jgi:hypothetical protein
MRCCFVDALLSDAVAIAAAAISAAAAVAACVFDCGVSKVFPLLLLLA